MSGKPFTLSVKVVLRDAQGRCLLVRRSSLSKNNAGKWDLPGGKVDAGENFDVALKREVAEETGLDISIDDVLGAAESVTPAKRVVYLILGGHPTAGEVRLSSEHDAHVWVDSRALAEVDLCGQFRPFAVAYAKAAPGPS